MNHLAQFKEMLDNQAESGIRRGDWQECVYDEVPDHESNRYIDIRIPCEQVTFRFNIHGRFVGIYNWKE